MASQIASGLSQCKFICNSCDYKCFRKSDYNKHLLTRKHKQRENASDYDTIKIWEM